MFKNFFTETKFSFANFMAFIVVGLCFLYFFTISGSKREENNNIGEIKTACIAIVTMVLGYYYGSSKSSSKKDETIQQLSVNAATSKTLTEDDLNKYPKLSLAGYKAGDTISTENYNQLIL